MQFIMHIKMNFKSIFVQFLLYALINKTSSRLVMLADKYEQCYKSPNSPFDIQYMSILPSDTVGTYVKGKVYISRDITSEELRVTIGITKCASKEALDTCELFTVLKPQNTCTLLAAKNTMWEAYIYGCDPPFLCPVKKGIIHVRNMTFDANLFSLFPIQNYYYELNITYYTGKDAASICMGMKFIHKF